MAPSAQESETENRTTSRAQEELAAIERKWAEVWDQEKVYESDPAPGQPKYFATYPYSYMNAFAHVGHAYTMMRVELKIRHARAKGANTLFPFGFHITGTPIVAAAHRIEKGDETQWRVLRESGIPEAEIPKFADPIHWVEYFPDEWKKDVGRAGFAIDWRRSFVTTDRNPYYDAFIRWQFLRLKDKGYVRTGKHPVIWDPVQKAVIGDHDRAEGEGVAPQEATLLKFQIVGDDGRFLIAATLRPETVFGQTNLWIDPRVSYQEVPVTTKDGAEERWIVSIECAEKMKHQDLGIAEDAQLQHVSGSDLVGKKVVAPGVKREIPVLPASFMKTDKWSGIVTSVPSDAPLDMAALRDLKADPSPIEKCGADPAIVQDVEPIAIIDTEGLGTLPAQTVLDKLKIKSQDEEPKLKQATEEVYQAAFYKGRMLDHCGAFGGMPVQEAKEAVKDWLLASGDAERMWEPESLVVSRHGNLALVKVVSDQWFVAYGDKEWKQLAHEAIDGMGIYPEVARKQFHIVVDWLKDWACTREAGLGTRLPWDERWLIESLSDSTIYMAYYTVSHHLERIKPDPSALTPAFWDHVLLGKGNANDVATGGLTTDHVDAMRNEFLYWYPLDYRNSGKDLLQNHLTFAVFNHTALFPKEHWIQAIAVNGWVTVDGEKMSKSKGNFITLRDAMDRFGVSATRLAVANAGEGLDDANFEVDFAHNAGRRIAQWLDNCRDIWNNAQAGDSPTAPRHPDRWFRSVLNRTIRDVDDLMSRTEFRSALKATLFDLPRHWSWYLKRTNQEPDPALAKAYVDAQARIMAIYVPHAAEELWHHMDGEGLVVNAPFPHIDQDAIDPEIERTEEYLDSVMGDMRNILKLIGDTPSQIRLYTAPQWKRDADQVIVQAIQAAGPGGRANQGQVMKTLMADERFRDLGKVVPQYVGNVLKHGAKYASEHKHREGLDELQALQEAAGFLGNEFGCPVTVQAGDAPDIDDPGDKAKAAVPGRPAVYVE